MRISLSEESRCPWQLAHQSLLRLTSGPSIELVGVHSVRSARTTIFWPRVKRLAFKGGCVHAAPRTRLPPMHNASTLTAETPALGLASGKVAEPTIEQHVPLAGTGTTASSNVFELLGCTLIVLHFALAIAPLRPLLLRAIIAAPCQVASAINILVFLANNGGIPNRGSQWAQITGLLLRQSREINAVKRCIDLSGLTGILQGQQELDLADEGLSSLVGFNSSLHTGRDLRSQLVVIISHSLG